jgi:thymidylate synthase ThyX
MSTPIAEAFSVRMIASSITENGDRIDTLVARYPRMIHSENMTHRKHSKNSSSSRAIPTKTMLVRDASIYVPQFARNKPGMQPGTDFDSSKQAEAEAVWIEMAEFCRAGVEKLAALGVHKEHANRPLEWFGYIDVLISSTNWSNFFHLRRHTDAQREMKILAELIWGERERTTPRLLKPGQWHLPFVPQAEEWAIHEHVASVGYAGLSSDCADVIGMLQDNGFRPDEYAKMLLVAMSAARSCRVSYSKVDGTHPSLDEDMIRFKSLVPESISLPMHASPLEHQARPLSRFDSPTLQGNLDGFVQFRKLLPGECA